MRNTLISISVTKKAALFLVILVILCLVLAVSCAGQAPSGTLPVWKVGDSWTMRTMAYGVETTSFQTVTGEQVFNGIDCYIAEQTSTTSGVTYTTTLAVDESTLQAIGAEISSSINGTVSTATVNMSYDYSVEPYPLSVGKTWAATINTTATGSLTWQIQTTTETEMYNYKVEKVESVTVPAGKFRCFKIMKYSNGNSILTIQWVTDVTGGLPIKEVDNVSGVTSELISYSLSREP
jgi:hypothetical protein